MDVLSDLRTTIPDPGEKLVVRGRLLDLINDYLKGVSRFLLVSAPAGYGKTTLIAEWLQHKEEYDKAWFSLDKSSSSPLSFFQGIITALQKIDNNICQGLENILKMPSLPEVSSIVASLIEDIRSLDRKLILVIDDLQYIDDHYIYDFFKLFVQYLPEKTYLIIITREDPPLMLNRYRLEGRMREIRADELCFKNEEMMVFFNTVMSLNMDKSEIEMVQQRAEGWISGAKLVGLNLLGKDRESIQRFIKDFSGSHHYIIDYLIEEVIKELSENVKEFLYKTSILERFSFELCNFITEREDSYEIIEFLEKMNLFLLPLDSSRKWYRYHHLFRDTLKSNLTPTEKKGLHLKASIWFGRSGFFEEAIQEALMAGDYRLAAKHMAGAIPGYLKQGDLKALLDLLDKIPDEYLGSSGLLIIIKAWTSFATGRRKDALYYIELVRQKPELIDDQNKGRLLTLTSLLSTGDRGVDSWRKAEEALELIDDDDKIFKTNALMSLGQIQAGYGKLQESVETFRKAFFLGRESGQVFMEIMSLINLALKLLSLGHLQEARTLCEQNIERYKKREGHLEPLVKLIFIPLGIIHYNKAEYQQAKEYLIKGVEISEQLNLVHVSWMPRLYYAQTCFEAGEHELAEDIIDDTLAFTNKYNLKPNHIWAENVKVEFALRTDNIEFAKSKMSLYKELCEGKLSVITARTLFTYCRILLNSGNYGEARSHLKRLEEYGGDIIDKIMVNILYSLVNFNSGDKEKARSKFLEAVQLAGDGNYLAPFIQEGKIILQLLSEFKEHAPFFVERVLNKINLKQGGIDSNKNKQSISTDVLYEELTEREEEILSRLADGLANKDIAERLFITEGTTKWHLSNIYSKMGVKNRTRAVAKAREIGLIE